MQAVSKPSYVEELSQIVQVLSEHGSFWAATAANSQKQQQKQQFNKHFFFRQIVMCSLYFRWFHKIFNFLIDQSETVLYKAQVYFLVKSQRFKKSSWILQIHPRYVQIQKQFS